MIITKEESKAFEDPEKAMELRRALEQCLIVTFLHQSAAIGCGTGSELPGRIHDFKSKTATG